MITQKTDLIGWLCHLKQAAHQMIFDDNILSAAPPLFQQCEDMATRSDGVHYDSDQGAFTLLTELFYACLFHQFSQVELLFLEYFPLMHPQWKLHREIWLFRFLMYQRFQLSDGKIRELCNQLENRIQSGKIQSVPLGIWEHWLMPEE